MCLYPPWTEQATTRDFAPAVVTGSGPYAPIFDPPRRLSPDWHSGWRVDTARLECQWAAVLALAAVALAVGPSGSAPQRFE